MRLLIIGDLHGQMPEIHFKKFDAILSVGDICNMEFIREIQFSQLINQENWYASIGAIV